VSFVHLQNIAGYCAASGKKAMAAEEKVIEASALADMVG
jgi:hypothetical protein